MRHETIAVFKFEELNEDAKERARQWFRQYQDFSWDSESLNSIKVFCNYFDVTLEEWECRVYSSPYYKTDAKNQHFRGKKLSNFDRNFMPTGYCLDCALWQTFYDTFKKTGDAKGAFDAALWAGFIDWRNDMEWQLSDEYTDDAIIANEYEFTESGDFHA